jgi:hypothetical protein
MTPPFFRLWFEAVDNKRLSYLLNVFDRRMRANMLYAIKQLAHPREASDLTYRIMDLYDGLWTLAATDKELTREVCLSMIAEYIGELIAQFEVAGVRERSFTASGDSER